MNKNEQKLSGFNGLFSESILLVFSESVASSEGDGTPSSLPNIQHPSHSLLKVPVVFYLFNTYFRLRFGLAKCN